MDGYAVDMSGFGSDHGGDEEEDNNNLSDPSRRGGGRARPFRRELWINPGGLGTAEEGVQQQQQQQEWTRQLSSRSLLGREPR